MVPCELRFESRCLDQITSQSTFSIRSFFDAGDRCHTLDSRVIKEPFHQGLEAPGKLLCHKRLKGQGLLLPDSLCDSSFEGWSQSESSVWGSDVGPSLYFLYVFIHFSSCSCPQDPALHMALLLPGASPVLIKNALVSRHGAPLPQ